VLALFGLLLWQMLNFYVLSTDQNRINAIKTHHMVVYDISTGKILANLPSEPDKAREVTEEEQAPEQAADVPDDEIAVVLTGIGKDADYTSEVTTLPADFIFSFSPYGPKPLETSKFKASEGAIITADILYDSGKFDISANNNDFRNLKNAEAAVSKIFAPSAAYIAVPDSYINSAGFNAITDKFAENNLQVIIASPYAGQKANIVSADVFIKAVTPPEEIKQLLIKLETTAHANGYAMAVIEPQPGVAVILKDWSASLKDKKLKLVPVIKN
jgi:hypothetical protein